MTIAPAKQTNSGVAINYLIKAAGHLSAKNFGYAIDDLQRAAVAEQDSFSIQHPNTLKTDQSTLHDHFNLQVKIQATIELAKLAQNATTHANGSKDIENTAHGILVASAIENIKAIVPEHQHQNLAEEILLGLAVARMGDQKQPHNTAATSAPVGPAAS